MIRLGAVIAAVLVCLQLVGCRSQSSGSMTVIPRVRDDECVTVVVANAVYEPTINGEYELDRTFGRHCSSRPVWKQVGSNHTFIYYLEDGYDGWMIGADSCFMWGNFLAGCKSAAQTPYAVRETWTESVLSEGFVDSPGMSVRCAKIDGCYNSPCANGATCIHDRASDDVTCVCSDYYTGSYCQEWNPLRNYHQQKMVAVLVVIGVLITVSLISGTLVFLRHNDSQANQDQQRVKNATEKRADSTMRYQRLRDEPSIFTV